MRNNVVDLIGTTTLPRARLFARIEFLAQKQAGVVGVHQLYAVGMSASQLRAQLAARRWRRVESLVIALSTGPLTPEGRLWTAVLQGGPQAYLDGVSALTAAGLKGFTHDVIRVSVPQAARSRGVEGAAVRRTRRHDETVVVRDGIPRTLPQVAAVRGALWARSNTQAQLLLTMTVQQGLASPQQLAEASLAIRRDKRRNLIHAVVFDLAGGVRSLSEAEFAKECRARGLPEPSRQVKRSGRDGNYYLDAYWEDWGVAVEIDGIHHAWAENIVSDALRQNTITLQDTLVLRLPLMGLRAAPDAFFAQIEQALRARGWDPSVRRAHNRAL